MKFDFYRTVEHFFKIHHKMTKSVIFLTVYVCDAICAKFTTDLQKSTLQALFPLSLRDSTIFLVQDIDKQFSDS